MNNLDSKVSTAITMVKTMSVKNKKEKTKLKDYWRHNMILDNKKEFINYLQQLTSVEDLIDNINENSILKKLQQQSEIINDFVVIVKEFIQEEIIPNIECYNAWKDKQIKEYVKYFIDLIKEESTYKNETELHKFRMKMKQKRNTYNFIIESIYAFHNNQRKISITRLDKEFNKPEYVNLLMIIFNILLTFQCMNNLYGFEIDKTYTADDANTVNKKIQTLWNITSLIDLETVIKWLYTMLFQIKFISENWEDIK